MRPAARRILLIRHGRSAHVHARTWVDAGGFERSRSRGDLVGIDATDSPPRALVEIVSHCELLVSSDLPRAVESAARLAPGRSFEQSPLLRETALRIPDIGWLRLPVPVWDALTHAQWGARIVRGTDASDAERTRAADSAAWLSGLATKAGSVAVVTHGVFRRLLTTHLRDTGWHTSSRAGGYRHWSIWSFEQ